MIMDVDFAEEGLSRWDIQIFEHVGESQYLLHHEEIGELGVSLWRIKAALESSFEVLEEIGRERRPAHRRLGQGALRVPPVTTRQRFKIRAPFWPMQRCRVRQTTMSSGLAGPVPEPWPLLSPSQVYIRDPGVVSNSPVSSQVFKPGQDHRPAAEDLLDWRPHRVRHE